MTLKINLFQGWFIGATVFTCGVVGDYLCAHYFDGSRAPWFIAVIAALIINWWGCSIIKQFSQPEEQKSNPDKSSDIKSHQ